MNRNGQRGVALISVLFVVVIVTILASQILAGSKHTLERTRWLRDQAQAYQYAIGGEQMARQLLYAELSRLREEGLNISPLPGPVRHFRPEHGTIILKMTDLQGLVNLNNITGDNHAGPVNRYLADFLEQPELSAALADWIDGDTLPRPGGREDHAYLNLDVPRRAANRPLNHISELAYLRETGGTGGYDFPRFSTALERPTALNINTLVPELAPLIHPRLSPSQLEIYQQDQPFESIQQLMQSDLSAGLDIDPSALTVSSNYYRADVITRFGDWEQSVSSRFFLDPASGEIHLLERRLNPWTQSETDWPELDKEAGDDTVPVL